MGIEQSFWKGKRVFITGHTGFKGSWLSIWLNSLEADLTGFALSPPTVPSLFDIAQLKRFMISIYGDVRDAAAVKAAMVEANPEIVIHMAAQPIVRASYEDPIATYETNVMGTAHVLEASRSCPALKAVVVVTTDKCYDNKEWHWGYREHEALGGWDPYSSSKACAEILTAAYRRSFFNKVGVVAVATARAGNVIGGGDWAKDRLIPDFIRAIEIGEPIRIRSPNAIRPWQHVLEPLSGYLLLAEALFNHKGEFADAWNFGPSDLDAKPVEWIVKRLCALFESSKGYLVDDNPQPHEAGFLKLDSSKSRALLGWSQRWSLETALRNIVEWNKAYSRGDDMYEACLKQIAEYLEAGNNVL
jgi:CDP-glucose 4,6-dehydratase